MKNANERWSMNDAPKRITSISDSKITEVADLGRDNPKVIKLWIGEGDLKTPEIISRAATKALEQGYTRYTFSRGLPALHEALQRYHKRHWGVNISTDRFSVTCGGMGAVMQAFQAILEPDEEVIVPCPVWPNVWETVRIVGGQVKYVLLDFDETKGFSLDLEKIASAITPKTRAIYINSPHNPTGCVLSLKEMEHLLKLTRQHGLWLVSDEVYNHFTYSDKITPSFLQLSEPNDRLIVTNTFSKNWCMTGWRLGWMIYPQGMQGVFDNLGQFNTTSVATFLQYGAIAALDEGDEFIQQFVQRSKIGRDIICSSLETVSRVRIVRPEATFYAMFSVDGMTDGLESAKQILREANVGVAPGSGFGFGAESYLRVCFGVDHKILKDAGNRLTEFFAKT